MKWTDEIISQIRSEINSLPHGQRNAAVERWASQFGCSPATIRRRISTGSKKCSRKPDVPDSVIEKIITLKSDTERMGPNGRMLATEDAIEILEQGGVIDPGTLTVSTADRRMRKMGFKAPRVYSRHEDDYVNQVHKMDFSRSEYFEVVGFDGNDYIVRVDGRKGQWAYKNKPKDQRLRLWVVAYIDSVSRAKIFRYYAATGENLMMVTQFLSFAWERKDSEHPFIHLPLETLKLDQGAIGKSAAFRDRLRDHLGIRIELAAPKNDRLAQNQSMGKVERPFRTLWQRFELKHAKIMKMKGIKTIPLTDLNDLVHRFAISEIKRHHPVQKTRTISEVYQSGLRMKEQRRLKTDIFTLLYAENTRTVSATADISIDNQLYKVPEQYVMQKVRFYTTPDGELMGSSMDRKDTFDLIPFDAALATGKRTHSPTVKEKLADKDTGVDASGLRVIGGGSNDSEESNIKHLPAREKEQISQSPFTQQPRELDTFSDWRECKKYICQVNQCRWKDLAESTQHLYQQMFETGKLTEKIIDDLAQTAS